MSVQSRANQANRAFWPEPTERVRIMLNNVIADTHRLLLTQGIAVIHGDTDLSTMLPNSGWGRIPDILPVPAETSLYCAIWCNETEDTHFTPCEGEWDFATIADIDEYCPIKSLTIANGVEGDVLVEIAWKDYMYTKLDIYRAQVEDGLNRAIGRVLATIALNRTTAI